MRALTTLVLLPLFAAPLAAQESEALVKYFNKYPFDEVDGSTFLQRSEVVRVVRRSIPQQFLQEMVLSDEHTAGPIDGLDGYLQMSACEQHNCDDHRWVVAVKYDGSKGAVCYFNKDLSNGSRWFVDGRKVFEGSVFSTCETGRMPSPVLKALDEYVRPFNF
ncbi:hypothetical protein ABIE62_000290 [Porphyrobacter sp. MBR-155]|jgi:hypothetical protein|uniref:hypothetical protein n=1 Tax=Porphyrobacter sp. MBR-155 TaxID=3156464 RepID=UPI00339A264B